MKNKTVLTICLIIIATIILVGGYFVFIKKDEPASFLKLEKIVLKDEEKKVKVNNKELTLKLSNGLLINGNKLDVEIITNIYSTGEYLIVAYKGNENDKYKFINEEGSEIPVTRVEINEDAEFSNLRLEANKLVADTCDVIAEITYNEGKITIKK